MCFHNTEVWWLLSARWRWINQPPTSKLHSEQTGGENIGRDEETKLICRRLVTRWQFGPFAPQDLPWTQRSSAGGAGICNAVLCNSQLTLLPLIMSSAHFLTPRFSRKCKQKIFSSSWNGFMSNLNLRSWRSNEERQLNVFKRCWWIYNKPNHYARKSQLYVLDAFVATGLYWSSIYK